MFHAASAPLILRRIALVFGCALSLLACSKQGEGERCDLNSASLDCDDGLVCRSADQLSIEDGRGVALCCPINENQPTVDACRAGSDLPDDPEEPGEATPDAGDGGV